MNGKQFWMAVAVALLAVSVASAQTYIPIDVPGAGTGAPGTAVTPSTPGTPGVAGLPQQKPQTPQQKRPAPQAPFGNFFGFGNPQQRQWAPSPRPVNPGAPRPPAPVGRSAEAPGNPTR